VADRKNAFNKAQENIFRHNWNTREEKELLLYDHWQASFPFSVKGCSGILLVALVALQSLA